MNTRMLLLLTLLAMAAFMAGCDMRDPKSGDFSTPLPERPVTELPGPIPEPTPTPDPTFELEVEIVKGDGDYFDPVVVDVEYTKDGVAEPYTYEVPHGRVEDTPAGIRIYSDGQLGEHTLLINDEEYRYSLVAPPVCAKDETYVDCVGLQQPRGTDDFIYYGEDDTRIVYWDLVYVGYMRGEDDVLQEADAFLRSNAERNVEASNEKLAQSGVYVRLRLKEVWGVANITSSFEPRNYPQIGESDFLVIAAQASGVNSCGFAGQGQRFRGRAFPLRPLFYCGTDSFIHEIGHSAGLGHGANNGTAPGGGSTFFFAIGSSFCGRYTDIMQYGGSFNDKYFSNHKMTCKELTGVDNQYADDMAGSTDLGGSSTAYALNRVRYDVSLVHNEHDVVPAVYEEFVCDKEQDARGVTRDCYGYEFGSVTQTTTWAGPDDIRVAVIDLALARNGGTYGEVLEWDHPDMVTMQRMIDRVNAININSHVHIHFNLVAGIYAGPKGVYGANVPRRWARGIADIVVGWGPGNNAGEALIQRAFVPGQVPPALQTTASSTLLIHELGHVMGLGHGVWGQPDWRYSLGGTLDRGYEGSYFPAFSHGWQGRKGICGLKGSVMSYQSSNLGWSNSLLGCEADGPGAFGMQRGSRDATDEAYHLNRVRWNVSRVSP